MSVKANPRGRFDLSGKAILVTGGSRGLGFAMAEAILEQGGTTVLCGRNPETLDAAAAKLAATAEAAGGIVETAPFDVADEEAARAALEALDTRHGLYGLINNAGIQHRSPILEFDTADFERVVTTNLTSAFTLSREAARLMIPRGAGSIVSTVSMLGPIARPTVPAYTAAKEGLRALTRALAVELGPSGIRVNAIAPGYFGTEMNTALVENKEFSSWVEGKTPLGRWGLPEEIGGAAAFLMSPAAAFVSGHILAVDGGMSIQV